ncbi:MAG: hypothetical protein K2X80_12595 [Pseudomonadaceae bacterium]|nr:hypothetical protein [Pseudomonadaceae bacterium]
MLTFNPTGQPCANPAALATFRHEVAVCVGLLLEQPDQGQILVLIMERGQLVANLISARTVDLNNLLQYEMIIFAGNDKPGSTWRHAFFPHDLRSAFVGDCPLQDVGARFSAQELAAQMGFGTSLAYRTKPIGQSRRTRGHASTGANVPA